MKKIYTLAGILLVSTAAFAQVGKPVLIETKPFNYVASHSRMNSIDTTGVVNVTDWAPAFNPNGTQCSYYGYSGGGKLFGNNKDQLNACAQGYQNLGNPIPVNILGVLTWVGGKTSTNGATGGTNSVITVKAWKMAPNKAWNTNGASPAVQTQNSEGPSTLLGSPIASTTVTYADIDTTNLLYAAFPTPPLVPADFAVGIDFNTLAAGDTAGLVNDALGSAANIDLAFHYYNSKWWVTDFMFSDWAIGGSGGFDTDVAIWAVLSDAAGVSEYFNGMKLTTYPNPAVEKAVIEYTLEKNSSNVSLLVFDKAGHKLIDNNYSNQNSGTYKVELETAKLAAGTYFYQLNANGHNFTKQFVVTK